MKQVGAAAAQASVAPEPASPLHTLHVAFGSPAGRQKGCVSVQAAAPAVPKSPSHGGLHAPLSGPAVMQSGAAAVGHARVAPAVPKSALQSMHFALVAAEPSTHTGVVPAHGVWGAMSAGGAAGQVPSTRRMSSKSGPSVMPVCWAPPHDAEPQKCSYFTYA